MIYKDTCPFCGGKDFTWGRIGGGYEQAFYERGSPQIFPNGKAMVARHCETCGNVQQFTKFPVSKREPKEKRKRGE